MIGLQIEIGRDPDANGCWRFLASGAFFERTGLYLYGARILTGA